MGHAALRTHVWADLQILKSMSRSHRLAWTDSGSPDIRLCKNSRCATAHECAARIQTVDLRYIAVDNWSEEISPAELFTMVDGIES